MCWGVEKKTWERGGGRIDVVNAGGRGNLSGGENWKIVVEGSRQWAEKRKCKSLRYRRGHRDKGTTATRPRRTLQRKTIES